ncbi:MAG: YqgE/AlgH family protein [Proteobacteria bacterium]|nr:YqgE/AlgH family protein [Pseudomonadota bacterium]MCP4918061.1 YqgE/AlgH family protein [Pseudomonadota bacterium]
MKRAAAVAAALALGAWLLVPVEYPILGTPGSLPPLDEPCVGERIEGNPGIGEPFEGVQVLICFHDGELGTVGFLDAPGPLATGEQFILYEDASGLRWSNCATDRPFPSPGWLRAPRVTGIVSHHVGYAGWATGQLTEEIEAGAWTVVSSSPR